jgi:S1-C subfamily serine protease
VGGGPAGGPPAAAGILVGDLVLQVEERPVASPQELLDLLSDTPPGRTLHLDLLRGGSTLSTPIVAGERPKA